eukprot:Skav220235  [mRNA]  locus=scaffold4245:73140:77598:- [translate_table: standard]
MPGLCQFCLKQFSFYALAVADEGHAQAIASMDYATPHRPGTTVLAAGTCEFEPRGAWHVPLPAETSGFGYKERPWLQEETAEEGADETMYCLGAASLRGVFSKQFLADVRLAFTEGLSDEEAARPQRRIINHWWVRLGESNVLLEPLSEYLGRDFVLESALIITVAAGTEAQNAHTDTDAGHGLAGRDGVAKGGRRVGKAMQRVKSGSAQKSENCLCQTGVTTHHDVDLLDDAGREVRRWRCIGESKMDARKRIAAGRRVKREELWEPLVLRVLRAPHVETLPKDPPPKLLVGAPLCLGDIIIYEAWNL